MNRPYTKLQIVIICAVLAFLILIALWLSGCAKTGKLDFIWVEGADCTFVGEGMTVSEMTEIQKDFHFGECAVNIEANESLKMVPEQ